MAEIVNMSQLVYGIILIAIGAILFYVARYTTNGGLRKALEIIGIILAIIGIVLIVLAFLLPLLGSGLLILGG